MSQTIKAGYVRTGTGQVLVQKPADNQWGFELADDDQSWPGGFGIASSWELIPESEVSDADRQRLGWLLSSDP